MTKAQMITGVWSGKINHQKTEIKIIQEGDSLTGTSYYYESINNYRRYSIKGYFDVNTNKAVWWDDQLIEERTPKLNMSAPGRNALLSSADFNCPGGSTMMLDGEAALRDNTRLPRGDVHLDKTNQATFGDEWDYIIENYTAGANDPEIIDSIAGIARQVNVIPQPVETTAPEKTITAPPPINTKPEPLIQDTIATRQGPTVSTKPVTASPSIEEKFTSRKKVFVKEIPVTGDSIELRFYDNAEIDGDSISLFLNGRLIFQHIRLAASAYIIKIAVSELKDSNDLIMVAENLGSIPPNTSYMVALVGDQRYDARLESTEGSSAMIRLSKKRNP